MKYCEKCDIAFDVQDCPCCEANDEISDLEKKIRELEREIEDIVENN